MFKHVLPETERVQQQTNKEWLAEYEGTNTQNKLASPQTDNLKPKITHNSQSQFLKSLEEAGINYVRFVGEDLLITTNKPITAELDNRIKRAIPRLTGIAEPDTGETLYEYVEYRSLFSDGRLHLALVFKEIHTGVFAERYFNITLQNRKGEYFKTGIKGEFRIKGSINRPMKGSFIKFWFDTKNEVPDGKPSHIYRYMKPKLSRVVISCPDPEPHHGETKLHTWKYEGRLYKTT